MQFEEFTNALNFLYRRVCGGMRRFLLLHLSCDCKENKHKQKWRARKCTCIIKVIRSSRTSQSWIRFLLSLNLPRFVHFPCCMASVDLLSIGNFVCVRYSMTSSDQTASRRMSGAQTAWNVSFIFWEDFVENWFLDCWNLDESDLVFGFIRER